MTTEQRAKHAAYMREWSRRNADRVSASKRASYLRNRERILVAQSAYNARPEVADRTLAYNREYQQKNGEIVRVQRAEYRERNREAINEKNRESYRANKAVAAKKAASSYLRHRESVIARNRRWRAANPDKVFAKNARRRAAKAGAMVEKINPMWIYWRDKATCALCSKSVQRADASLDHIVPLSLGGPHMEWNVQLAHLSCNSRKGNRAFRLTA